MALDEKEISKQFSNKKIIIPILFGLTVSALLLYYNLSDVRFEPITAATVDSAQTYQWVDANGNGVVDLTHENEFVPSPDGDYIRITYKEILKEIHWTTYTIFWIILAWSMMLLRDVMYMYRIRALTDKELTWRQSFNVVMVWEFASSLTPGVVGGAALAMFILNREKIALGKATALVMITTMFDNLFFLLAIPTVYILVGQYTFFPPLEGKEIFGIHFGVEGLFWLAYGIVLFFFLFLFTGLIIKPQVVKKSLLFVFSLPILRKLKHKAEKTGNEIELASQALHGKPFSYWYKPFIATAIAWTGRFMVINFIIQGFVELQLADHFKLYARELGMWILMLISPTPGGSGVAEYTFTVFLGEFIPLGTAVVFAVLWRLLSYYPYLFIGSIVLPRWLNKTSKYSSIEEHSNLTE